MNPLRRRICQQITRVSQTTILNLSQTIVTHLERHLCKIVNRFFLSNTTTHESHKSLAYFLFFLLLRKFGVLLLLVSFKIMLMYLLILQKLLPLLLFQKMSINQPETQQRKFYRFESWPKVLIKEYSDIL